MSAADWISIAAGVAILSYVGADVFSTVLHPWGRAGPLSRALAHGAWRAARSLTRRLSKARRHRLLGMAGPSMIPAVVGAWAALVVLGFALLYLPAMPEGFQRWEPHPAPDSFPDAIYFSGYTFFTLGFGDIVPITTATRMLAIVQTGSGFALITLVISYFFSVYGAFTTKTVLAESLYYQAGSSAEAARIIARHWTGELSVPGLMQETARLRDGLVQLRSQYSDYPILHFFRDRLPEQSFLRLLYMSHELALLLDTAVDTAVRPEIAGMGTRSGLADAANAAQNALVRALVQQVPEEVRAGAEETGGDDARAREHFARARQILTEGGLPVRSDEGAAREYVARRDDWEPLLRACTEALGAEWTDVTGQREREHQNEHGYA